MLSELATSIYQILRDRVPADDPRISYGELVDELGALPPPNERLQAFDKRLFDALGEIGASCHSHIPELPALSSIVVLRGEGGSLDRPGTGYFKATHPAAKSENAKDEAWLAEFNSAKRTNYPESI
jgi:hypothetical protein